MDFSKIDWNKAVQDSLTDYEKTKSSSSSKERTQVDLTKYFSPNMLPPNEAKAERVFRIMPLSDDGSWYKIVKFHYLMVGKSWAKLYDPEQDGEESPLNDMYRILIKGDEDERNMARNYRSKDFFIVRGIERGKEHEGVKFWRFPVARDGSGIIDKIEPQMRRLNDKKPGSGAFFNPGATGRDLVITTVRETKGAKSYGKVTQILLDEPSPLSEDKNQALEWLNDPLTYSDVYKKKPIEYLRIVAEGSEPVWDNEAKKFIAKVDDDFPTMPNKTTDSAMGSEPTIESTDTISVDADDLPF